MEREWLFLCFDLLAIGTKNYRHSKQTRKAFFQFDILLFAFLLGFARLFFFCRRLFFVLQGKDIEAYGNRDGNKGDRDDDANHRAVRKEEFHELKYRAKNVKGKGGAQNTNKSPLFYVLLKPIAIPSGN